MKVVGIDFSSFAVDIVRVHVDDLTPPEWHHWALHGQDSFDRTRTVANAMPGRTSVFWDDVLGVGIEEPAGKQTGHGFRVQGAILSMIPPATMVEKWMPSQWRKAVGLPGNCPKDAVMEWVVSSAFTDGWKTDQRHLEQDACDAYCIALATREALTTERSAA